MKFLRKADKGLQMGIDIGNHYIKAVALLQSGSKPTLVNFSVKPVGDNVVQAIKDAHAELGFTKINVVTSISGPAVIVRYIEMPSMSADELSSAIRFEAEKVIPYNIKDVELDGSKLEDVGGGKMKVVIVAAKKDAIESQLNMVFEAGLEPILLDIDSFALMNAFVKAGVDKQSVCALLNIGAKRSNLNIIKGEISYISREMDIGSNDITKALIENLSLSPANAEKMAEEKLSRFLQLSDEEKKDIQAPVLDLASRLADEVRLSFDFYENQHGNSVDKVYVSGGTSRAEIIRNLLKENLGCEILKWDCMVNMELSEKIDKEALSSVQPQLAVAVGLALRSLE